MAKLPDDLSISGLGNIDDILHNQSVSDLSWLDVNIEEYKKHEALPKQNLDTIPELNKALEWDGSDSRVPSLIPLRPHAIVNTNPLEQPPVPMRSSTASIRDRTATYVMAGMGIGQIETRLRSEFDIGQLRAASQDVKEVLQERGLLGNVYINSAHFPKCAQKGSHRQFVTKVAKRSLYVLAKSDCTHCLCNRGGICTSFQKRIVDKVPYDDNTLAHYAVQLASEGRRPSLDGDIRDNIRVAFLGQPRSFKSDSVQTIQHLPKSKPPVVTAADIKSLLDRTTAARAADPIPSPPYMIAARRVMAGTVSAAVYAESADPEVRSLAMEHGLLGHTYLDGDSLGGPSQTLRFMRSAKLSPDFILIRDPGEDMEGLAALSHETGVRIYSNRPAIIKEHFLSALNRARSTGRLTAEQIEFAVTKVGDSADWVRLTSQTNLYSPPPPPATSAASTAPRGSFYYGAPGSIEVPAPVNPEEVRTTISSMMNSGLAGPRLRETILARYARSELSQVPEIGQRLASDDGVQGFYFLDPTAYPDYGHGCLRGSTSSKTSKAPYVLANSSCTGCTHQTAPSWCNRYSRRLIRVVPDEVRERIASVRRLPVVQASPVENPVEKYELQSELHVDLSGGYKSRTLDVTIPSRDVTG